MTDDDKSLGKELDSLQRKIDEARGPAGDTEQGESPASNGLGEAMRMGVELVAGVGVGSAFGFFIDRWLGTMPLFFILCLFLGAAAGFRNMLRSAGRNTENEK